MEERKRSRLCEILGVEEDEEWTYPGFIKWTYRIHNGIREYKYENVNWRSAAAELDLIRMIEHPELIIHKKTLTEDEIALCKLIGAKWVSRNASAPFWYIESVDFWDDKPEMHIIGKDEKNYYGLKSAKNISFVPANIMPSINPGDCICVEEFLNG